MSLVAQATTLAAALKIGSGAGATAGAQVRDAPLEPAALRDASCEDRAKCQPDFHATPRPPDRLTTCMDVFNASMEMWSWTLAPVG